jgi:hypothetical protein
VGPIIDILLSMVIRGAIAIAILNMTVALQGKLSEKTKQANMFNLVNTVGRVLGNDMKKVGYRTSSTVNFNIATLDSIEFKCDTTTIVSASPAICWIKYSAGTTSELLSTQNPNDRKLYRTVRLVSGGAGVRSLLATGVVTLQFAYYDYKGDVTSDVTKIISFSIRLVMATGEEVNGMFPQGEWTYRFFPANLN